LPLVQTLVPIFRNASEIHLEVLTVDVCLSGNDSGVFLTLVIGGSALALWIWTVSNDPTIKLIRRRFRLGSELRPRNPEKPPEEVVAVPLSASSQNPSRKRRRRHR